VSDRSRIGRARTPAASLGPLWLALLAATGCAGRAAVQVQPAADAASRSAEAPPEDRAATEPPAEQTAPRLLPGRQPPAGEDLLEQLSRLEDLALQLGRRPLTDAQREQLEAGSAFVSQARQALAESDLERAAILTEKGRTLIDDLAQTSGP